MRQNGSGTGQPLRVRGALPLTRLPTHPQSPVHPTFESRNRRSLTLQNFAAAGSKKNLLESSPIYKDFQS